MNECPDLPDVVMPHPPHRNLLREWKSDGTARQGPPLEKQTYR